MQRGVIVLVSRIELGAIGQQQKDHGQVAESTRQVQGGVPNLADAIHAEID